MRPYLGTNIQPRQVTILHAKGLRKVSTSEEDGEENVCSCRPTLFTCCVFWTPSVLIVEEDTIHCNCATLLIPTSCGPGEDKTIFCH